MSNNRKKIWFFHKNGTMFGPGKVVENLYKGLSLIKDEVEVVSKPSKADLVGCLQYPDELANFLPQKTLMGPNIFVLPIEMPGIVNKFANFVVPSSWVKNKYETFPEMQNKTVFVWPVGIDTKEWTDINKKPKKDFFIYQKNFPDSFVSLAKEIFEAKGMSCAGIIKYGKYNENDLRQICDDSRFAILCTNTESQGIAYMNMLSTGTPCFVFNTPKWIYERNENITAPASSVPYFSKDCGEVVDSLVFFLSDNTLENATSKFLSNLESYNPRQYIVDNHSLETSARKYVALLEESFKDK